MKVNKTSFDPVIDYYNSSKRFTCLIYFTDGECHTSLTPKGKCLWVLSSKSNINENLPGQIIQLN